MKITNKKKSIALLGVGLMGTGIGYNILQKGYDLCLLDGHSKIGIDFLKQHGAKVYGNLEELCSVTTIFILCLPSTLEVEKLCTNEQGLLYYARQHSLIIDCTTSMPNSTQHLHNLFAKKEIVFLDAPLTRTPVEAMQGNLNCLLSGSEEDINRAKPILNLFCENIFETGLIGSGNFYKILNNGVTLGIAALVSVILKVALEHNLDLFTLRRIVSSGGANNPQIQGFLSWLLDGDIDALKFSLKNASKDIGYLQVLANNTEVDTSLIDCIYSIFQEARIDFGDEATLPELCGKKVGACK